MEINEAPEKIYIPTILVANTVRYKGEGYIEYTRTDAFIEKATTYIQQHWVWNTKMIEDFKNYIKGE